VVILGIDPGARATGYGLLTRSGDRCDFLAAGVIRPPAGAPLAERLLAIDRDLREIVLRHSPREVAVESVFHARSARAAIVLGHARGIALLAAASGGALVVEYAPLEIKMAVTGTGGASKDQVRAMVRRLLVTPERLALDAADALAVALCHAHRRDASALLARAAAGSGAAGSPR
jgi:crossover junction endodeoxyribonuclease RuvC